MIVKTVQRVGAGLVHRLSRRLTPGVGLALLLAGALGYAAGVRQGGGWLASAGPRSSGVDYLLAPRTFSEIENTRALLDAQCRAFILSIRTRYIAQHPEDSAQAVRELEATIAQLQRGPEMLPLQEELLWFLKKNGQSERWLQLYLEVLYEDPTDSLIGRFAEDARKFARGTAREPELLQGFQNLSAMPIRSEARDRVQAVLHRWDEPGRTPGKAVL